MPKLILNYTRDKLLTIQQNTSGFGETEDVILTLTLYVRDDSELFHVNRNMATLMPVLLIIKLQIYHRNMWSNVIHPNAAGMSQKYQQKYKVTLQVITSPVNVDELPQKRLWWRKTFMAEGCRDPLFKTGCYHDRQCCLPLHYWEFYGLPLKEFGMHLNQSKILKRISKKLLLFAFDVSNANSFYQRPPAFANDAKLTDEENKLFCLSLTRLK